MPKTRLKAHHRPAIHHRTKINAALSVITSQHRPRPNDALVLTKAQPIQEPNIITKRIRAITTVSEEHLQQRKRDAERKTHQRKSRKAKAKYDDARRTERDTKDGKLSQESFVNLYYK
jgi:hypothetical protein